MLKKIMNQKNNFCEIQTSDLSDVGHAAYLLDHGYATKEGCRTERKSRNLEYAMGVRLTGFTT
jgi:hypothetical protein